MSYSRSIAAALALAVIAVPGVGRAVEDHLTSEELVCVKGVARAGTTFVKNAMKRIQECENDHLKQVCDCTPSQQAMIVAPSKETLRRKIASKCGGLSLTAIAAIGYPGKCFDADPSNGFTLDDLQDCMVKAHENALTSAERTMMGAPALIDVEYGDVSGPLDRSALNCQQAIADAGTTFTTTKLKAVQRCRNRILEGRLANLDPTKCATDDAKTHDAIAKAEAKARAKIAAKCVDADLAVLDVCDPPQALTVPAAQDCIVQTHGDAVDTTDPHVTDLIDFEYAAQPICGDNTRNVLEEECDGTDAADCPGQCGDPDGFFACLCLNVPRQRVVEHADSDLDNGWKGLSHDSGTVEGGGYVVDLYDCDGMTGVCTVGPSCEIPFLGSHLPCESDANCQAFGLGSCRKRRTAVGPHCHLDIQHACTSNADCPGLGNFCFEQFHGAPLPLSSGGVSVCVVNVFSESVVGTTNLDTGAGAVRIRQNAVTYLGPSANQPCPVCGGFCAGAVGMGGSLGARSACASDADCPGSHCVTDHVCSYGANADKPCRAGPPFGGQTTFFGTPSVDCGPPPGNPLASLDILFNPATTGTTTLVPNVECPAIGFGGRTCVGGANEGRSCTAASDCPGGTCNAQCFCPNGLSICMGGFNNHRLCCTGGTCVSGVCSGGVNDGTACETDDCLGGTCTLTDGEPQKPNRCNSACVGGSHDMLPCSTDASCPGGFCQAASCRVNPADTDSCQEGFCPAGPSDGACSVHAFKSCTRDADCQGASCPFCNAGETCMFSPAQCFVNSGIVRCGSPGVPDRVTASTFCIAATHASAVDGTAGLPGPGALTQPITTVDTGP